MNRTMVCKDRCEMEALQVYAVRLRCNFRAEALQDAVRKSIAVVWIEQSADYYPGPGFSYRIMLPADQKIEPVLEILSRIDQATLEAQEQQRLLQMLEPEPRAF